jgi:hypothetical protein
LECDRAFLPTWPSAQKRERVRKAMGNLPPA